MEHGLELLRTIDLGVDLGTNGLGGHCQSVDGQGQAGCAAQCLDEGAGRLRVVQVSQVVRHVGRQADDGVVSFPQPLPEDNREGRRHLNAAKR